MMSEDKYSDFEIDEDFLRDAFGENDDQDMGFTNPTTAQKNLELSSSASAHMNIQSSPQTKDENISLSHSTLHSHSISRNDRVPLLSATAYRGGDRTSLSAIGMSAVEQKNRSSTLLAPRNLNNAETVTTPRTISKKTPVRRRKFPGPAGLLPDKIADRTLDSSFFNEPKPEICPSEEDVCSQSSTNEIDDSPWLQLVHDFDLNEPSRLSCYNVKWIKRLASAKLLVGRKVPFLAIVIKSIDFYSTDPSVVLQDQTGEISGTLHRDFLEKFPSHLKPGTVLVLHRLGVVSTGFPVKRHYLNITLNNLISIYDMDDEAESDQVRVTRIKDISIAEIIEDIEKSESQSKNISTLTDKTNIQHSAPRNSLFNGPSTSTNTGSKVSLTSGASNSSRLSERVRLLNRCEEHGNVESSLISNTSPNASVTMQTPVPPSKEGLNQPYSSVDPCELRPKVARMSGTLAEPGATTLGTGENPSQSSAEAEIVDSIFQGFDCSSLFEDF